MTGNVCVWVVVVVGRRKGGGFLKLRRICVLGEDLKLDGCSCTTIASLEWTHVYNIKCEHNLTAVNLSEQ